MSSTFIVKDRTGHEIKIDGVTGDIFQEDTDTGYRVTLCDDNGVLLIVNDPISVQRITEEKDE